MQAIDLTTDEIWDRFTQADLKEQAATFLAILDAGEMDGDLAFDMLGEIKTKLPQDPTGYAHYKDLVWQLREEAPDVYKHEYGYLHHSLITLAINNGNWDEIPGLLDAFRHEPDLDIFALVIDQLVYHGLERILIPVLVDVATDIPADPEIVPWAIAEFVSEIGHLMLWEYLDTKPTPIPNDPDFLTATMPYVPEWTEGWLERFVPRLSVNKLPSAWSRADFAPSLGSEQWQVNMHNLLAEFVADQRRAGIPYGRADMAWEQIAIALVKQAGLRETVQQRKRRKKTKPVRNASLIPTYATLNKTLADLMPIVGGKPLHLAATIELLPAYLRFIKCLGLASEKEVNMGFRKMRKLAANIENPLNYYSVDNRCIANVKAAWEDKKI